MTSFSLILVVLGVYSILLYTALVLLLIPLGVMRAVVKDPRFTGLLDYLSWVTENKGMVYLITLPVRTILSTGRLGGSAHQRTVYYFRQCGFAI